MKYFLKALQNYAVFTGRASRSEYWYFFLFYIIFAIVAVLLDNMFGTTISASDYNGHMELPYGYIYFIFGVAMLVPNLAVSVRRLHDLGKSGWNLLLGLIPIIGGIWLLVLFATKGQAGDNNYGADPEAVSVQNY